MGAVQAVVHNCGGQVAYGSTELSQAVQNARIAAGEVGHNFAAARLGDGSIITASSDAGGHAEEYLLEEAGAGGNSIAELYSEREPCAATCAPALERAGITNVTWSWPWNGATHEETMAIRRATTAALKDAIKALIGG